MDRMEPRDYDSYGELNPPEDRGVVRKWDVIKVEIVKEPVFHSIIPVFAPNLTLEIKWAFRGKVNNKYVEKFFLWKTPFFKKGDVVDLTSLKDKICSDPMSFSWSYIFVRLYEDIRKIKDFDPRIEGMYRELIDKVKLN